MPTFTIDTDNNITAYATSAEVPEGQEGFATQKEFAKLSAEWPITSFVEIWNDFAGVPPFGEVKEVRRFTDRQTAVARIWKTIQTLGEELLRASIRDAEAKLKAATTTKHLDLILKQRDEANATKTASVAQQVAPVAPKKAKAAKGTTAKDVTPTASEGSKTAIVLDLLRGKDGATLAAIMKATGWQAHSVRGFISGALGKKMGLKVESFRSEAMERTYRLA